MPLHDLRDDEEEHIANLRLMPEVERQTLFALGRKFRQIGTTKERPLPDGVVAIHRVASQ